MNIISGLTDVRLKQIIRERITKKDLEYFGVSSLKKVVEILFQRVVSEENIDLQVINEVQKKLKPYIAYLDKYIKKGEVSLYGQSIGNLLHAAVMMKEGAYSQEGIDQKKYRRGLDILMDIFNIDNVKILLSSFDEATLYVKLKDFEVGTENNLLREAVPTDGSEIKVGGITTQINTISDNEFELLIKEYPDYRFVIKEDFGDYISRDKNIVGKSPSQTSVKVYKNGNEVQAIFSFNGEVQETNTLDIYGRAVDIQIEDLHLKLKGRLVVEQTHITDGLNRSAPVEFGFIDGVKPEVNSEVLEALDNTKGMIAAGPGSRLTSIDAVLITEGILPKLKELRMKGKVPIVKVENPITDNETVGMSYQEIIETNQKFLGGKTGEFFNMAIINDMEKAVSRLKQEERELIDEYGIKKDKLLKSLKKGKESFSDIAKLRRGEFEGDSQYLKDELEKQGVTVIYKDLLSVIGREGRGVDSDKTIGFPLEKLAEIFEDVVYEKNIKQGIYWQALQGDGLSESVVLRMLHEVSRIYPNMSFAERVKFLYDIQTKEEKKDLGLPIFNKNKLKSLRPDLLVLNFAGTQGYAGAEEQREVTSDVINAYISFLENNPEARMLIRTGVGFEEIKDVLLNKIPLELKYRIIVASNKGAVIYGFNKESGQEELRSRININDVKYAQIKSIINEGIEAFGFDREVTNTFEDVIARPIDESRIREREAQFVVELEEYMTHPILRRLTKDKQYADVAEEFAAYLNQRLEEYQLAFKAEVVGIGAVNIIAKNIQSLDNIVGQVIDEDFDRPVSNDKILFLGHGFDRVANKFKGSTHVVFGPLKELFSGAQMYPLLGPKGFTNLLINLTEGKQARVQRVANIKKRLTALQKADFFTEASEVKALFKEVGAWNDKRKRGILAFLLNEEGIKILQKDEEIVFEGVKGIKIIERDLFIEDKILEKIKRVMQIAIFADMDQNLAPRKKGFSKDMQETLSALILYGMAIPSIVTDNGFDSIVKRLEALPEAIRNEMVIYADGAGNRYVLNQETGEYQVDESFRQQMGTEIKEETFRLIKRNFFRNFTASWRPFLLDAAQYLNNFYVKNGHYPSSKDIDNVLEALMEKNVFEKDRYADLREILKGDIGKSLKKIIARKTNRAKVLSAFFESLEKEGFHEEGLYKMQQVAALMEILRVVNSENEGDLKEKNDMIAHYLTLDEEGLPVKDKELKLFFRGGVQIPLSPIRPALIRDMYAKLWKNKFDAFKKNLEGGKTLELYPGGMTTINIKDERANKGVPVEHAIEVENIPARHTEFSGDEFKRKEDKSGGRKPDAAVADLQAEKYEEIIVRNTSLEEHDKKERPNVLMTQELEITEGLYGPEANVETYGLILDLLKNTLRDVLIEGKEDVLPVMEKYRGKLGLDVQASSSVVESKKLGGINFNPELLDLQVQRDDKGIPLPLFQQSLENIQIEGVLPVIINITPILNFPQMLGFSEVEDVLKEG